MKRFSLCLLIVASISLFSCTTTKPLISSVDVSQISELALLEPIAYISLIEQGNRAELNDSLSYESTILISDLIRNVTGMPFVESVIPDDEVTRRMLNSELEVYFTALENTKPKKRHEIEVPPTIITVLKANGYRFGLAVISEGFTRKKGNYGGQVAQSIAIGVATAILSGGMVAAYPIPVKSRSNISCIIIDAQTESAIFYNRQFKQDADPLEESHVLKQLNTIFKDYLNIPNY